jgi:hypothetical protein
MLFNDLLARENVTPDGVLVLRHRPEERELRKVLPWLAAEHHDIFNAYQQTQTPQVERAFLKARYVASFIGLEKGKGSAEYTAVFVGLYKVGDHRPLTYREYWEIPANNELKRHGAKGFVEGDSSSILWFDLKITEFYTRWNGKLVIEWPRPAIAWSRWANKREFPIHAILEDSVLHKVMPDWKDCIWSWTQLGILPAAWRDKLSEWRGIYYIYDCSDGKAYVGAAYGKDNIFGRWWEHYKALGQGDSVHLRERSPENFRFSILERVSQDMEADKVIALETTWKKRLHTQWPSGLNGN